MFTHPFFVIVLPVFFASSRRDEAYFLPCWSQGKKFGLGIQICDLYIHDPRKCMSVAHDQNAISQANTVCSSRPDFMFPSMVGPMNPAVSDPRTFVALLSLHVHAGGDHDISVAFVGAPKVLEKDNGLEVNPQDPPSSNTVGLQYAAQHFANGGKRLGLARRLDDSIARVGSSERSWRNARSFGNECLYNVLILDRCCRWAGGGFEGIVLE